MKYTEVNPFTGKNIDEDAPANATGPSVAGTGDDSSVVVVRKKKKKDTLYDGRTRIARKFIERILKQRESRRVTKEEVELDEVLKPKDKKVIDDFVQANKGTGAQNFTKRGSIVDYEGRSLEKSGIGAQQIASLETDGDKHKIKVHAKMDGRSTQSIVNYLKKSAKKYDIKVEETTKEEPMMNEKIEYVEYKFKNRSDAMKAQKHFMKQNQGPDYEFMDDDINNGTLGVDAGKDDMTKHHNEVMRKFKPKIVSKEDVEFDDLEEAVADLFVKDDKPNYGNNANQIALKIAKNAKGLGLKSAIFGGQVRVKGSKKQVNDFMRSVLGKSSMGSPTEKGASNPQIDKMLNKQLKEDVFRSNDFVGKILEKVNDFGNEHELVETNLKVLQNIVKRKQNQKVKFKDKQATVDLFTANAIMKVYDAVKPDNKKKIEKLMNGTISDFLKLQKFAMKQVKFA